MDRTPTYIPASVLGGPQPGKSADPAADDGRASTFSPLLQKLGVSALVTIIATAGWTALIADEPAAKTRTRDVSSLKQPVGPRAPAEVTERPPDMVFVLPPEPATTKAVQNTARVAPARPRRRAVAQQAEAGVRHHRIRPNPY